MPREYKRIKQFEKELLEMKKQGYTHREMGEALGYSKQQIKEFFCAYNERQRKLEAGIAIRKKGRPAKNPVVTEDDRYSDLRYKLARKDTLIRQLEKENKLMRDFLLLTGRK